MPAVSLIIPTNRPPEVLDACLASIAAQEFDAREVEVVVVFNGVAGPPPSVCGSWPFRVKMAVLAEANICAAKNRAVELAEGQWLIFINDDVRPASGFVAAHLHAHWSLTQPALVLGLARWRRYPDETVFDRMIADTSMIFFYDRMEPHHWYNFRHAWNLNLSLPGQYARAVRFDERLKPVNFDDLEWAFRLEQQHGLRVWYAPEALLEHDHRYTLDAYLQREFHLGRMAARLWHCNPECYRAIYGSGLTQRALAAARRRVAEEEPHAAEIRAALEPLVTRPMPALGPASHVQQELIRGLYLAHRPLKRFVFNRGLVSEAARSDAQACPDAFAGAALTS